MGIRTIQKQFFVVILHFGEASDAATIDAIAGQATRVPGTALLEVKPHPRHSRTQLTLACRLEKLPEVSLSLAEAVAQHIHLENRGPDYRWVGTLDSLIITPLVLRNLPLAISAARDIGHLLSKKFRTPVFLVHRAATKPEYSTVQAFRQFRAGDIPARIRDGKLKPDFGANSWNAKIGAILVGARLNYLSFALYLDTEDIELVETFARQYTHFQELQPAASGARPAEKSVRMRRLDLLKEIVTMVDLISEHRMVQLLCKITDYQKTPLHEAFSLLDQAFDRLGIKIIGSQIFGFIPFEVLQQAGRYFFRGKSLRHMDDLRFFTLALNRMRVDAIEPFHRNLQVLEYRIQEILDLKN